MRAKHESELTLKSKGTRQNIAVKNVKIIMAHKLIKHSNENRFIAN